MISGTYENPWALLSCAIKVRSTSGANFGQVPSWKREIKIIEEEGRGRERGEREAMSVCTCTSSKGYQSRLHVVSCSIVRTIRSITK